MQAKYHHPYPPKSHHNRKLSNRLSVPRNLLHPTRLAVLAIIILIVLFFNFQSPLSTAARTRTSEDSYGSAVKSSAGVDGIQKATSVVAGPKQKEGSRVAIVTFTTEQKSYMHLSLRNHDRTFRPPLHQCTASDRYILAPLSFWRSSG